MCYRLCAVLCFYDVDILMKKKNYYYFDDLPRLFNLTRSLSSTVETALYLSCDQILLGIKLYLEVGKVVL